MTPHRPNVDSDGRDPDVGAQADSRADGSAAVPDGSAGDPDSDGGTDAVSFVTTTGIRVPSVTRAEMARVDRVATEEYGLPLLSMMENAGRNLARASRAVVGSVPASVFVAAGGGGNGGGGLAAARHLANQGVDVTVGLDRDRDALQGASARQLAALAGTDATVYDTSEDAVNEAVDVVLDVDLAIDALVGYGLDGALDGKPGDFAQLIDEGATRALSLDVPSGFDADTGAVTGRAVHPDATLTLALPKPGLASVPGALLLGDIGIPRRVFERAAVPVPEPGIFRGEYVVAISHSDD